MDFADLEYSSFDDLEYSQENEAATFQQLFFIENLLRNSTFDDDARANFNTEGITQGEASKIIETLKANQLDMFRDTNRFGQRDLVKHINKML